MKKILIYFTVIVFLAGIHSCQEDILQVPDTTGMVNQGKVFSSSDNAVSMLMANYRTTVSNGWGGFQGWYHGTIGAISGETARGYSWHGSYLYSQVGPLATGTFASAPADNASSVFQFTKAWNSIRANWLVNENIDEVPDMDDANKSYVKAETQGLIAYWYLQLFKNYGGMPIISRSFASNDSLNIPRASLQKTLDFTLQLCDKAVAGLPDKWEDKFNGRLTKGALLATKAQVLMYAARPLFNSASPYLENGANNNLICFGNVDEKRWNAAITASEAALAWATANGKTIINTGGGINLPNKNALDDYGTATSTPNNPELILAAHIDEPKNGGFTYYNTSAYWTTSRYNNQLAGLNRNFLLNYYTAAGGEQSWPNVGDAEPVVASDYVTKFKQMEPRFLVDFTGPGIDAANNLGDNKWSAKGWNGSVSNNSIGNAIAFPNGDASSQRGTAVATKFYYKAGARTWFEFPVFRVAELYLNLAEAYNEVGNSAKALENLNVVHNRAGLPSVTETNQAKLRDIIQREWAIEFFNEGKRYYDVRHWKYPTIATTVYGNFIDFQFNVKSKANASVNLPANLVEYWAFISYNAYWNPKMYLEPIPQAEVNKLVITQNPGY